MVVSIKGSTSVGWCREEKKRYIHNEKWDWQAKKYIFPSTFTTPSTVFSLVWWIKWVSVCISLVHFDGPMMNQIKNIKCFSCSFFFFCFHSNSTHHPSSLPSPFSHAHILFYSHSFSCVIEFICSVESQSQQQQPKKKYNIPRWLIYSLILCWRKRKRKQQKSSHTHTHTSEQTRRKTLASLLLCWGKWNTQIISCTRIAKVKNEKDRKKQNEAKWRSTHFEHIFFGVSLSFFRSFLFVFNQDDFKNIITIQRLLTKGNCLGCSTVCPFLIFGCVYVSTRALVTSLNIFKCVYYECVRVCMSVRAFVCMLIFLLCFLRFFLLSLLLLYSSICKTVDVFRFFSSMRLTLSFFF